MASVAYELFHNKYWMNVEERAFYSDDELEHIGIMGVNTMEEAETIMSRFRQVRINIPALAMYYKQGYRLEFISPDDISPMFDIINKHLDNWTQLTNQMGYIATIPPIEDFELLDDLASVLFPYRKINNEVLGIMKIFQGPLGSSNALEYAQGVYKPYSPNLFKYCQQVRV